MSNSTFSTKVTQSVSFCSMSEYFSSKLSLKVLLPSPIYLSFWSIRSLICLPIFSIDSFFVPKPSSSVSIVAMVASIPIPVYSYSSTYAVTPYSAIYGNIPHHFHIASPSTPMSMRTSCSKEPTISISMVTSSLHSMVTLMPTSSVSRKPLTPLKWTRSVLSVACSLLTSTSALTPPIFRIVSWVMLLPFMVISTAVSSYSSLRVVKESVSSASAAKYIPASSAKPLSRACFSTFSSRACLSTPSSSSSLEMFSFLYAAIDSCTSDRPTAS